MDEVTDGIWIGTAREAADRDLLERNGITAIVSLSSRQPEHEDLPVEAVPLSNGPGTSQDEFDTAVDAVLEYRRAGESVLVHCRQGVSRSVAVAAAAMAIDQEMDLRDAVNAIELERPRADPDRTLLERAGAYLQSRR